MTPIHDSMNVESQETNLAVVRRFTENATIIQAQGVGAYNHIAAQPPSVFQDFARAISALGQRLQLTLHPHAVSPERRRAVGLREMRLSEDEVAELRRHIEHPSALPKLPLRAIPEEEADELY